jgi:hypothetical protein
MKVYELMNKLSGMPSGADVVIFMVKSLDEMNQIDDDGYSIRFPVREINLEDEDTVEIDGY